MGQAAKLSAYGAVEQYCGAPYPSSHTGQQPIQNIERESIKRDAQTHR
jgi:hypothetical protein